MSDLARIGRILVLIGGIIGIIEGVLMIFGVPFYSWPGIGWSTFGVNHVIVGIFGILFSLIALANSGAIKIKALEFSNRWLIILIMGILMYLFASGLGGILVIIGAIFYLLARH
ncbi:MAG: hypothetical protein LUQ65_06805 [Candidatus Helarchaeota archaeon]|nr:hypothetical protein [Candidatus Helarchaeota archaeon]